MFQLNCEALPRKEWHIFLLNLLHAQTYHVLSDHPKSGRKTTVEKAFDFIKSTAWARFLYLIIDSLFKVIIKYFSSRTFFQFINELFSLILYQTIISFKYELLLSCISFIVNIQIFAILWQLNITIKLALSLHASIQRIIVLNAFYFFCFESLTNHIGRFQVHGP